MLTLSLRNRTLSRCSWRILNNNALVGRKLRRNLICIGIWPSFGLVSRWIPMQFIALIYGLPKHVAVSAQRSLLLVASFVPKIAFRISIHGNWIWLWWKRTSTSKILVWFLLKDWSTHLANWRERLKHENLTLKSLKVLIEPHYEPHDISFVMWST